MKRSTKIISIVIIFFFIITAVIVARTMVGNYFKKKIAPPITDDHTYINQITKIPVLDIIHYDVRPFSGRFDFGSFHHTHADNMDVIHKPTLKAVGQTVLDYLYNQ